MKLILEHFTAYKMVWVTFHFIKRLIKKSNVTQTILYAVKCSKISFISYNWIPKNEKNNQFQVFNNLYLVNNFEFQMTFE
jgi:hypothetical protein